MACCEVFGGAVAHGPSAVEVEVRCGAAKEIFCVGDAVVLGFGGGPGPGCGGGEGGVGDIIVSGGGV